MTDAQNGFFLEPSLSLIEGSRCADERFEWGLRFCLGVKYVVKLESWDTIELYELNLVTRETFRLKIQEQRLTRSVRER